MALPLRRFEGLDVDALVFADPLPIQSADLAHCLSIFADYLRHDWSEDVDNAKRVSITFASLDNVSVLFV